MPVSAIAQPSLPPPPPQRVLLTDISWQTYEQLRDDPGARRVYITYDNGVMELMSPLNEHESSAKFMGRLAKMLAWETHRPVRAVGSLTVKRRDLLKGLEPDECYYIRHEPQMRARTRDRLDFTVDPPPDLAIEADITRSSVDRMSIYAALGVPEVWRWDGRRVTMHELVDGVYRDSDTSVAFPAVSAALLTDIMNQFGQMDDHALIRRFLDAAGSTGDA